MSDNASGNVDPKVEPKENEGSNNVSYEAHQKLLGQRKADQARAREIEEKYNTLKAEKAAAEEAALSEQGKFQEMFEAERKRTEELESDIKNRNHQDVIRQKKSALQSELQGLRRPEYLNFADINSIQIMEDGSVDPESVQKVASGFRESYADLISSGDKDLPNGAPTPGKGRLTYQEWEALPLSEKYARSHEVKD